MSQATLEDLRDLIDNMMKERKIQNYQLDYTGNLAKGEGYVGDISYIQVRTGMNGHTKVYKLVAKAAKQNASLREITPIREVFLHEVRLYKDAFPAYRQYEIEKGVKKPFDSYAKCYGICEEFGKELLVLKDIKVDGFEMHDRKVPQNLEHALCVFANYAHLHAISFAFKKDKPEEFWKLTHDLEEMFGKFACVMNTYKLNWTRALAMIKEKGLLDIWEKLKNFDNEAVYYLTKLIDDNPSNVLIHGDCWNNNMMFRYEDSNKCRPVEVRLLDFQLARAGSPILDLSYYLYTCCDHSVLDHFDYLLEYYHKKLTHFTNQLGYKDLDKIFSLKKLKDDWKTYGKFGMASVPTAIKFELCNEDEAPDLSEQIANNAEYIFDHPLKDPTVYNKRVIDVLSHFANRCM